MNSARIAVDAMGGDHAPACIVAGALDAARDLGLSLALVGPPAVLEDEVARQGVPAGVGVDIVAADHVVGMGEPPAAALRSRARTTIRVAAELVASGEAAALFSAGHTGASVLAARSVLDLLPGVERPALATTIPTLRGAAVLLDAGATVECRPSHLVQFAVMGQVYARVRLGCSTPRVGLLSIGEEEIKGNELTREAHRLFKQHVTGFVGNVEANELYLGGADVIVCDGFTGNVALKVSEGLVDIAERLLRAELGRRPVTRLGAWLCRPAFQRFHKRVDYAEYGGVPLLGVAGLCLIGHGRSSAKAVRNGVAMAHRFATEHMLDDLARELGASTGAPEAAQAPGTASTTEVPTSPTRSLRG